MSFVRRFTQLHCRLPSALHRRATEVPQPRVVVIPWSITAVILDFAVENFCFCYPIFLQQNLKLATSLCFQLLFRLTLKYYKLVGLDIYNLSANYNGRKHWSMKTRNLWSFWSTLGRERSTTSTKSCSLSSVPNEWQLHLSLEMCGFTCCQV